MLASTESVGAAPWGPWVEALLWWTPGVIAGVRILRGPVAERRTWCTVALASLVIGIDKLVDVLIRVHHLGQDLVRWFDPNSLRGRTAAFRYLLLGGLFLSGVAAIAWVSRTERRRAVGERLALLGLVGVMGYLGLRLVPPLHAHFTPVLRWCVEYGCWACVVLGGLWRSRGGAAER